MKTKSKPSMRCYLCSSNSNIVNYNNEDGICKDCLEEQTQIIVQFKQARTQKYPEIDLIEEGFYLGNEDAATSEEVLKQRNITAICACGTQLDTPFNKDEKYVYKTYEIQDYPKQNIKQYFNDFHAWVKEMRAQKRSILVHCAAGVSRSASFTISYFMKEKQMPYPASFKFVKSMRQWISPNSGFREQLKQYNKELGLPQTNAIVDEYDV